MRNADVTNNALLQVLPSLLSVRLVIAIGLGYGFNPAPAENPFKGQMIGDVMLSEGLDLTYYKPPTAALSLARMTRPCQVRWRMH